MLSDFQRRTAALKLWRALSGSSAAREVAEAMKARPDDFAAAFRGLDPNETTAHDFAIICVREARRR